VWQGSFSSAIPSVVLLGMLLLVTPPEVKVAEEVAATMMVLAAVVVELSIVLYATILWPLKIRQVGW
jgi:hypothetical protein